MIKHRMKMLNKKWIRNNNNMRKLDFIIGSVKQISKDMKDLLNEITGKEVR